MRRAATFDNPYRLSPHVTPRAYRLHLEPDIEAARFTGRVEIDLELTEATSAITLNALDLDIQPGSLRVGPEVLTSAPVSRDADYETVTFDFSRSVPAGPVSLSVEFAGVLNDQLHGFYRSSYVDAHGVTRTIATTQFESTDARRAFPCFDDPAQKATFEITLVVPGDMGAFSNSAEVASRELADGRREVRFAPTMVMSTYLVAFVVGPFEATAERLVLGVPTRVVHPVGKGHLSGFALELLEHALVFFSEYFDRPYPGDKIDLVAVPDFAAGAMENLGCVTFREEYLLIDPAVATDAEMRQVALVVNHEVAHMWFGDLVTMEWWEGIWLNEALRPSWRRSARITSVPTGAAGSTSPASATRPSPWTLSTRRVPLSTVSSRRTSAGACSTC